MIEDWSSEILDRESQINDARLRDVLENSGASRAVPSWSASQRLKFVLSTAISSRRWWWPLAGDSRAQISSLRTEPNCIEFDWTELNTIYGACTGYLCRSGFVCIKKVPIHIQRRSPFRMSICVYVSDDALKTTDERWRGASSRNSRVQTMERAHTRSREMRYCCTVFVGVQHQSVGEVEERRRSIRSTPEI
jgi:hypothetical protein